ncbi:hypothetical protein JWJ90_10840 [Desulfobulbus rhabdoformis]|uniref:hypothetical protein n=1 Tax=Desulfobulbus rhabdoformis TaxID=34032 RepID=UPI0019662C46|nr:hypothetical protein [Desulfobulbus rhabdoformis]MBM9614780.1 hypothetical protein [Desulfobulbus rhabdoformis]
MANVTPAPLVGFEDINTHSIENYEEFKTEGLQYLQLAENAFAKKKKAFTTEILYNIAAMAIEKLVMSSLMEIGRLPYNHTMHDLVDALEKWMPETVVGIADAIRALDSYQDICDPDAISTITPTVGEIEHMLGLARTLQSRLDAATA